MTFLKEHIVLQLVSIHLIIISNTQSQTFNNTPIISSNITCRDTVKVDSTTEQSPLLFYSFVVSNNYTHAMVTTCNNNTLIFDTKIDLYDSNFTFINTGDDDENCIYNSRASSLLIENIQTSSTYYVSVSYWDYPDSLDYGDFGIELDCFNGNITEPTTTSDVHITSQIQCGNTTLIYLLSDQFDIIETYYSFTLSHKYTSAIISTCSTLTQSYDTGMSLYDSNFRWISDSSLDYSCGYTTDVVDILQIDQSGNYIISMWKWFYDSQPAAVGLTAECFLNPLPDAVENVSVTSNIECSEETVTGLISSKQSVIYYTFTLPNNYKYARLTTCTMDTPILDTTIAIYNETFAVIDTNHDDTECKNNKASSLMVTNHNITYYVAVTSDEYGYFGLQAICDNDNIYNDTRTELFCNEAPIYGKQSSINYSFIFPSQYDTIIFTTCNIHINVDIYMPKTKIIVSNSSFAFNDNNLKDNYQCLYDPKSLSLIIENDERVLIANNTYYISISNVFVSNNVSNNHFFGLSAICVESNTVNISCAVVINETCYIERTSNKNKKNVNYICDPRYKNCEIICSGPAHYYETNEFFHCPSNDCDSCTINLNAQQACNGATIYSNNCFTVNVNINSAQESMKIYAPGNNGNLMLNANGNNDNGILDSSTIYSVENTKNIILDSALSFSNNLIKGIYITGYLNVSCHWCTFTEIVCPYINNELRCFIECRYCNNMIINAVQGTKNVNWMSCDDNDEQSCLDAMLRCNLDYEITSEWVWRYKDGWGYEPDTCVNYSLLEPTDRPNFITNSVLSEIELASLIGGVVLLLCIIGFSIAYYCRYQYANAFIIDKALVLIIGIATFIDDEYNLKGVKQNVDDLTALWSHTYKYDTYVCNADTLYSTKNDIVNFIDRHKYKLEDSTYKSVIVHIISHAGKDCFTTSDLKTLKVDFIRHELVSSSALFEEKNVELIKLIFHHGCRGKENYHIGVPQILTTKQNENNNTTNNKYNDAADEKYVSASTHRSIYRGLFKPNITNKNDISCSSNCVTVYGNIENRAMSDCGYFTRSICDLFKDNAEKTLQHDFVSLLIEIGNKLEQKTKSAEICTTDGLGTLRYYPIRYAISKKSNSTGISNEKDKTKSIELVKY
eukprot:8148_1